MLFILFFFFKQTVLNVCFSDNQNLKNNFWPPSMEDRRLSLSPFFFLNCLFLFLSIFWLHLPACGILVLQSGKESLPPEVEGRLLTAGPRGKNLLLLFIRSLSASKSSEPGNLTPPALTFKSPRGVRGILFGRRCCANNFVLNQCRQQRSPRRAVLSFSSFCLAPTSPTRAL